MEEEVFWDNKRKTLVIASVQETSQILSSSDRNSGIFFSIRKNHKISPPNSVHSISKLFTNIMLFIHIV
jgi:hypothetical protein